MAEFDVRLSYKRSKFETHLGSHCLVPPPRIAFSCSRQTSLQSSNVAHYSPHAAHRLCLPVQGCTLFPSSCASALSARPSAAPTSVAAMSRAPQPVERVVATAFADAQRSHATHSRASKALTAAAARDPPGFLAAFLHALNRALLVFAREPAVERVIALVAAFAAERSADVDAGTANFSSLVLQYLLEHSNARDKAVRFRTCQTLAAALMALPEDAALDEDLWTPLQDGLLRRAFDKIPRVRAAAAAALCRLQTTGDPEDDVVTKTLVRLLSADSSSAVRKAALAAVAPSQHTIPHIIARIRDVKDDVRRAAFSTLATKVHPNDLELDTRILIMRAGLKDRSLSVRNSCAEDLLVSGWFEGACEANVFDLVDLLGGAEFEDENLLALRIIFAAPKRAPLLDAIQIDINNLTSTDALVLRAMCEVKSAAERLEHFIPSTIAYVETLKYYSVDEFASKHLLTISRRIDLSDEAGRRALEAGLREYFLASRDVAESVIPDAVAAMRRTMLSEDAASRVLVEIVLQDVLSSSNAEDCSTAGLIVGVGDAIEADEWSAMRALGITKEILRDARPGATVTDANTGIFLSLVQTVVIPRLTSPDGGQRHAALECLALFCLLDTSAAMARRHVPLFVQACRNDNEDIQILAIKILADMFMVFDFTEIYQGTEGRNDPTAGRLGGTLFTPPPYGGKRDSNGCDDDIDDDDEFYSANGSPASNLEDNGDLPPTEQVVTMLSERITHVGGEIRAIASEALARLLFSRRVAPSPKLLSRLLIAYYNPVNKEEEKLRQCLSVFFPAFAFSSPHHRLALETTFIPTLRILFDAPGSSPLSEVSPLVVAQFVLHLTNPSSVPTPQLNEKAASFVGVDKADAAGTTHERIAEAFLHLLLDLNDDAEDAETSRVYSKVLAAIRLVASGANKDDLLRLKKLSGSAVSIVQDKRTLTQILRFDKHITSLVDENYEDEDSDDNNVGDIVDNEIDQVEANEQQKEAVAGMDDECEEYGRQNSEDGAELCDKANIDLDQECTEVQRPSKSLSRSKIATKNPMKPLAERVINLTLVSSSATADARPAPARPRSKVPKDVAPVSARPTRRATAVRQSYAEERGASSDSESDDDSYDVDGNVSDL
jgi:condensin complex subunit 3